LKEVGRKVLSRIVVESGATKLGRRFGDRDGALILYGHRVADDDEGYLQGLAPEWLDEQLRYLTHHYQVIALSELQASLKAGRRVPPRSIVLTFDDGFRDNYTAGFPLFQKYDVPVTIFLATGCIDGGELPWSQRLGVLFQRTSVPRLAHPLLGGPLCLLSEAGRHQAYKRFKEPISRMTRVIRDRTIAEISEKLEVRPPTDRMLSWAQVKEMHAAGIEFGAHTRSHPMLARISEVEAVEEMRGSRDDLSEQLGVESPAFCFPAGSMNAALRQHVERLGFSACFTTQKIPRVNQIGSSSPFELKRVGLANGPAHLMESELDGPFHPLRRLLRRQ